MAYDSKYGRVTTEFGTIGEDEPVVVFRGQDSLLPTLLEVYRALCIYAGSPDHHLELIDSTRRNIEWWQERHPHRVPNSDAYMARVSDESA